eukprot:GHVS01028229.1.p1 GENE.GHVS01028229.1~~GHVS01028229.1.p1  ORF type:complete len:702 (+),score=122.49 GHVS01028229.1:268-2373(+)
MLNHRGILLLAATAISATTGCLASLGSETGRRHLLPSSSSFSGHFSTTYVPGSHRIYEASPELDSSFFGAHGSVDSSRVFWEPTDDSSYHGVYAGSEGAVVAHEEHHPHMHINDVKVDASSTSDKVEEQGNHLIVDHSHTHNVFNTEGVTSHYGYHQPMEAVVEIEVEEKKIENKPAVVEVSHRHIKGSNGSSADDWHVVIGGKTYKLNPEWISGITDHLEPVLSEVEDVTMELQKIAKVDEAEKEEVQKVEKIVEAEKADLLEVEKPEAKIHQHDASWSTHGTAGGLLPVVPEMEIITKEDQLSEVAVALHPEGAETEHEDIVESTARKNEQQQLHERYHTEKKESFSSEAVRNVATTNSFWGNNMHSLLSDEARLASLFKSAVLSLIQQEGDMNRYEEAVSVEKPKTHVETANEEYYRSNEEKKVSVSDTTVENTTQAYHQQQKSVEVSQVDEAGYQTAAEKKRESSAVKKEVVHSGVVAESFAETAVRLHNEYRSGSRGVNGPLTKPLDLRLPALQWDDKLAVFIDSWLNELTKDESCAIKHSSNYMRSSIAGWEGVPIGENLFKFSTTRPIEQVDIQAALASWYNEISCYRYGPFQHPKDEPGCQQCPGGSNEKGCEHCGLGSHIGHFTQIMWEGSKKIGCGYRLCEHKQLAGFMSVLIGCEYGIAGNMVGQVPFGRVVAEKLNLGAQPDSCSAGHA